MIDRELPNKPVDIKHNDNVHHGELCRQLGLPSDSGIAAYEDAAHFALVEQKLPINLTPENNKLDDEAERARVIKAFERGLENAIGYVLPIQAWQTKDRGRRWATERWQFRRGRLFLMPGDSPVGLRLPLAGLPYLSPVNQPQALPQDTFAHREPLPESPRAPAATARRDAGSTARSTSEHQRDFRLRAHRDGSRTARWTFVCIHASDRKCRGLRRPRRGHRRNRRSA